MRLYDSSEQTKSISNLIDECKNNIFLFSNTEGVKRKLEVYKNKMREDEFLASALETLKHRRDKMLVYNDKKYFFHPEKDNSYLPMYQLWMLRDFTKEVSELLRSCSKCSVGFIPKDCGRDSFK